MNRGCTAYEPSSEIFFSVLGMKDTEKCCKNFFLVPLSTCFLILPYTDIVKSLKCTMTTNFNLYRLPSSSSNFFTDWKLFEHSGIPFQNLMISFDYRDKSTGAQTRTTLLLENSKYLYTE